RGPPILAKQIQDGADECSRVTNADPENEVHDGPTPGNGIHVAVDADPLPEEVANASAQDREPSNGYRERQVPGAGGTGTLGDATDHIRNAGDLGIAYSRTLPLHIIDCISHGFRYCLPLRVAAQPGAPVLARGEGS